MVSGFHHTGLVVKDLARMVDFYSNDLGLQVIQEIDSVAPPDGDHTGVTGARRKLVFLGFEKGHQIELVHYIDPPSEDGFLERHQLGSLHICFKVDDLRKTCEQLKQKGVRFLTDPKFREIDGRDVGVVYAQDPEDNWLEFIEGL